MSVVKVWDCSILQVYDVKLEQFLCRNKYFGRALSVEGFEEALCQYLNNGERLRLDLIPAMLERLESLKNVLESLQTFRFYTSSLLIIYESKDDPHGLSSSEDSRDSYDSSHSDVGILVDVRMIDFAHATYEGFQDDSSLHIGPDSGFIFGLENLIDVLKHILDKYSA